MARERGEGWLWLYLSGQLGEWHPHCLGLKKAGGEQVWGGRWSRGEDQEFGFRHSKSDVPVKYPRGDVQTRGVAKIRRLFWTRRLDETIDGEEFRSKAKVSVHCSALRNLLLFG